MLSLIPAQIRTGDGEMSDDTKKWAAGLLSLSAAGLVALASLENGPGNVPPTTAYTDSAGVQTICTGHINGVTRGMRTTLGQCEQWLVEDTGAAGRAVGRCVKVPVTQEQYDALVLLDFNIGDSLFCASTLVRRLNAGDCTGAAVRFGDFICERGKPRRLPDRCNAINPAKRTSAGLVKRRATERAIFEAGCETPAAPATDAGASDAQAAGSSSGGSHGG